MKKIDKFMDLIALDLAERIGIFYNDMGEQFYIYAYLDGNGNLEEATSTPILMTGDEFGWETDYDWPLFGKNLFPFYSPKEIVFLNMQEHIQALMTVQEYFNNSALPSSKKLRDNLFMATLWPRPKEARA